VPKSDQEWLEARDQVFDKLDNFIKRFNNRLTFDNLRLVERYIKGELQLLLHFFAGIGGSRKHYVAHLRFLPGLMGRVESVSQSSEGGHIAVTSVDEQLLHSVTHENAMVHEEAHDDSTVLVHDVKSVENPQQRLPTLARIDLVDRFYHFWPEGRRWIPFSWTRRR
jgi:hypothetical protein